MNQEALKKLKNVSEYLYRSGLKAEAEDVLSLTKTAAAPTLWARLAIWARNAWVAYRKRVAYTSIAGAAAAKTIHEFSKGSFDDFEEDVIGRNRVPANSDELFDMFMNWFVKKSDFGYILEDRPKERVGGQLSGLRGSAKEWRTWWRERWDNNSDVTEEEFVEFFCLKKTGDEDCGFVWQYLKELSINALDDEDVVISYYKHAINIKPKLPDSVRADVEILTEQLDNQFVVLNRPENHTDELLKKIDSLAPPYGRLKTSDAMKARGMIKDYGIFVGELKRLRDELPKITEYIVLVDRKQRIDRYIESYVEVLEEIDRIVKENTKSKPAPAKPAPAKPAETGSTLSRNIFD